VQESIPTPSQSITSAVTSTTKTLVATHTLLTTATMHTSTTNTSTDETANNGKNQRSDDARGTDGLFVFLNKETAEGYFWRVFLPEVALYNTRCPQQRSIQ
jgi:hypothetical protein